jgi:hypothetical protein
VIPTNTQNRKYLIRQKEKNSISFKDKKTPSIEKKSDILPLPLSPQFGFLFFIPF